MICPNCKVIVENWHYCPECGTDLMENVHYTPSQGIDFNSGEPTSPSTWFQQAQEYEFGDGVPGDIRKAFELYLKSAKSGHADSMCHIGYLMMFGYGVERHTKNALYWLNSGISSSKDHNSIYYKNAILLKEKLFKSGHHFIHEEARLPALIDNINDYNNIARKIGFMPLSLNNGHLSGAVYDGISLYYEMESHRDHYTSYCRLDSGNKKTGFLSSFKEEFQLGRLSAQFMLIVREMNILGFD